MRGLDAIAVPRKAACYFFGNHHGAMLTTGAAKRQSEVALAFVDVVRQQKQQQIRHAIEKFPRLREADDVVLDLRVFSSQIPEFRNEVWIRQESDIEDQIGIERHAPFVSEADRRDEQVLAVVLAHN